MQLVFHAPVVADQGIEVPGIGPLRRQRGQAAGAFLGALPDPGLGAQALDPEGLSAAGKPADPVPLRAADVDHGAVPGLDSAMAVVEGLVDGCRRFPVNRPEVLPQGLLVLFDRGHPMVRPALRMVLPSRATRAPRARSSRAASSIGSSGMSTQWARYSVSCLDGRSYQWPGVALG